MQDMERRRLQMQDISSIAYSVKVAWNKEMQVLLGINIKKNKITRGRWKKAVYLYI